MYIDIHSHSNTLEENIEKIFVIDIKTMSMPNGHFCLGLHPWDVNSFDIGSALELIQENLAHQNFWALGEIGLDKKKDFYEKQIECFKEQVTFAVKNRIPRLIIHNVKAEQDIFHIIKQSGYRGSIIFHDWNCNIQVTKQFQSHFDAYFSFGEKLFNPNTTAHKTFPQIDSARIFLETDDQKDLSIQDIYDQAALLKGISLENLRQQINNNLLRIS